MKNGFKFPEIKVVDTELKDFKKPGIRISDVRWTVTTAGPSPLNNERTEIFLEGCKKAIEGNPCKGCFNISTWVHGKNKLEDPVKVAEHIANNCNGYVSIGGGEPSDQIDGLIELVKELKKRNIHILLYTWRDLVKIFDNDYEEVLPHGKRENYEIKNDFNKLLKYIDILIDGPFIEEEKILNFESNNVYKNFVGSKNQTFWDIKNKKGYNMEYMLTEVEI